MAHLQIDSLKTFLIVGEEARNPQRTVPRSIVISLIICSSCYCAVSVVMTLMVPYYDLDINASLPMALYEVNENIARWIVSIGEFVTPGYPWLPYKQTIQF